MIKYLLYIGLGGFLGSVARYLTSVALAGSRTSAFPWGTFAANIIGCFLIGILFGWVQRTGGLNESWQLFLITGFCGGYTTFSAFSLENFKMLQQGQYALFACYALLSIFLGIAAVVLGFWVSRLS